MTTMLWGFAGAAVLGGFLGFGCAEAPEDDSDRLKIGVLFGFTGESAIGFNYERSVRMVADQINDGGGLLGSDVKITARDTASDLLHSVEQADDLLKDNAKVVLGPDNPELARRTAALFASRQVAHVIGGGILPPPALVEDTGAYLIGPSTETLTCALADKILKQHARTVAILHTEHVFEKYFAIGVENALLEHGDPSEIEVARLVLDESKNEWVGDVQALQPDAIVLAAEPRSGMRIVNVWSVVAPSGRQQWYFSPTLNQQFFLNNIPSWIVEGGLAIGPSFGESGDFESFEEAFHARWSDEPFASAAYYYDGFALLALAIEAAGGTKDRFPRREEIGAAMEEVGNSESGHQYEWNEIAQALQTIRAGEKIQYRGVTGDLRVNSRHGIGMDNRQVSFWRIQDGRFVHSDDGSCSE